MLSAEASCLPHQGFYKIVPLLHTGSLLYVRWFSQFQILAGKYLFRVNVTAMLIFKRVVLNLNSLKDLG